MYHKSSPKLLTVLLALVALSLAVAACAAPSTAPAAAPTTAAAAAAPTTAAAAAPTTEAAAAPTTAAAAAPTTEAAAAPTTGAAAAPTTEAAAAPTTAAGAPTTAAAAGGGEALLASLPAELKALYENTTDTLLPSAYDNFQPVKGPWKICSADSYQGNPWRVEVENQMKFMSDMFQAAGMVSGFELAVSNGDVATQNSQIRQFIDKGCSVIVTIPESSTGINEAIKAAYDKGIPVVTMAGFVTSPYAINTDSNYYRWGYDMMDGIGKRLNGKGNVIMVEGIAGQPVAVAENQGAADALKKYPDLKVVAHVNGNWTLSVTKSVVLQALATHPEQIDAIWTTGSETRVVSEAFKEAGRPQPWITGSLTGDALGYWKANPQDYKYFGNAVLPGGTAQPAFRTAIRILSGQHPKLNVLMIPLPPTSVETLDQWYQSCMKPDSTSIFPVPPQDYISEDLLNAYFTNGKATPPWDYAKMPKPCGS